LEYRRVLFRSAALARTGVRVNRQQGDFYRVLAGVIGSSPEARAHYFVDGRLAREGDLVRDPELADALDRFGAEGAAPFYTGDVGAAISDWVRQWGGTLSRADLAAYQVARREPVRVTYRGRDVYT